MKISTNFLTARSMGRVFAVLLLLLLCGMGPTALAQDNPTKELQEIISKEKEDNIRRLLRILKAGDLGVQAIEQQLEGVRGIFATLPEEIRDKVIQEFERGMREAFTAEKMIELVIPIYDKYLSNDEVKGLIAFYETPLGQKLISVQPQITKEAFERGSAHGLEVGRQVFEKLKAQGLFDPPAPPAPKPSPRRRTRP